MPKMNLNAQENLAIKNAEALVRRSMQDDTPKDVTDLALKQYQDLLFLVANSRERRRNRSIIHHLFNR